MKSKLLSVLFLFSAFALPADTLQAQSTVPSWELADQVYVAVMKLYSLNKWEDAEMGLEGFIQDFPTSQNIPVAYLQLAHSQKASGKNDKCIKTLEKLLATYPDSYAAKFACGNILLNKYSAALASVKGTPPASEDNKAKKKPDKRFDDFIRFATSLESKYGGLYQTPYTRLDWRRPGDYYYYFSLGRTLWYPHYRVVGERIRLYPLNGWKYCTGNQHFANQILTLAKDRQKANDLLRAFGPCFKQSMTPSWKVMYAKLQVKSKKKDKDPEAQDDNVALQGMFKKYLSEYDNDDPFIIGIKSLLLKEAWDAGNMELVKQYSNELIDNFAGFEDIYYPFTRWMSYVYNTGDSKEFIRLSKLYMQKNPMGLWRENVIVRWVSLAERGAVKPAETLQMVDAEIATCPLNHSRVRGYLFNKISVLMAAKNQKQAVDTLAKLLEAREYWSKETFDEALKYAGRDSVFAPLIEKARSKYCIPELKNDSPAKKTYDDLQFRIKQGQIRHMEELADKLYNQYRRDGYAIQGLRDLVYYFYSKARHDYRNKWADIMISAYPLNPATQEVLEWQVKAAKSIKDYKMLAKYADIAMRSFPGANYYDSWIRDRLSCYDTVKELEQRIKQAGVLLEKRADSGELAALGLLGSYECSGLGTPTKQCSYWHSRASQFKGKLAEIYCYKRAYDYGYVSPCNRWAWTTVDFKGVAKAANMLGEQKFNDGWQWKYKFDSINILSQGGLGDEAAKEAIRLLPEIKHKSDIQKRIDLPNFGMAIGKAKVHKQAASLFSRIAAMCKGPEEKYACTVMKANVCRFADMRPQAAKGYLAAAKYYKHPLEKWQATMLAASSVSGKETARLLSAYVKQLKTAQDCIPGVLERIFDIYTREKMAKPALQMLTALKRSYKDSSAYGSVVKKAGQKAAAAKKR